MAQASESVAIYWDFENLHANLVDQAHGQGAYQTNRFRPQDEPALGSKLSRVQVLRGAAGAGGAGPRC
jgi:hypothetical protein